MRRKRKFSPLKALAVFLIFVLVTGGVFLGFQYVNKTGIFKVPGVVSYDQKLKAEEKALLEKIFNEDVVLDEDVEIVASESESKPAGNENQFLVEVFVPVTDFYSSLTAISLEQAQELMLASSEEIKMIPIAKLTNKEKLLAIGEDYYLESFNKGAIFRTIEIKTQSRKYQEELKPLIEAELKKDFPEKDEVLTFVQTGVMAFSRIMNTKLAEKGPKHFAEKIGGFFKSRDLVHTSNEASFYERASSAGATGTPICAKPAFLETMLELGINIVELTGNHNRDCGIQAAKTTVEKYLENEIKIVGGGRSATEAAEPLKIDQKNNKITMLAYNQSTGGATRDNTPGANQYYENVAKQDIDEAKARGDFVIVDIQYYECNAYDSQTENGTCDRANSSAGDQVGFFRHLIDLGADLVVGTSAHQPQTFELYSNGAIYYGLGNLFFDQYHWPGTTRSLVLSHYFYKGKLLQTQILPTVYDSEFQTRLMDEADVKWFIERLVSVRP